MVEITRIDFLSVEISQSYDECVLWLISADEAVEPFSWFFSGDSLTSMGIILSLLLTIKSISALPVVLQQLYNFLHKFENYARKFAK